MAENEENQEIATFGAGCFWGVEETFRTLKGVLSTMVGYCGGSIKNPTYERVCYGTTGHAETVQIKYNPEEITYGELLKIFWDSHNPTTRNRQGPDIGTQYRSVIFYHNELQKNAAEASKNERQQSGRYNTPIVTEIVPATKFYPAEEYHQKYLMKKGAANCHI